MPFIWKSRFVVLAGIVFCILFLDACQQEKKGGPPAFATGSQEVTTVTLGTEKVPIVTELPARACSPLVAEIRPQVGGIITKRLFDEGAYVKAGDLLYQIDPSPYRAAYKNVRAALAKAEANLVLAQAKAERYRNLVPIKGVSQQDYDEAYATLKQAEAEVEVNQAALETAEINLRNTKVTAPISGRVGKSTITVGALATANQASALATIQQIDPIFVDAARSSASLLRLKREVSAGRMQTTGSEKTRVRLLLEDGTEYPFEGRLKFSDITVDAGTGSYTVRTSFPNPDAVLMPGMYVRARIQVGVREAAILVPQQAVARDAKGDPYAFVVDRDSKAQQRAIIVDRTIGDKWLVLSGLSAGDRVIIEGMQKVKAGQSVKAVPFDEGPRQGENQAKHGGTGAKGVK